eukprot:520189-Pelagomonas_calceolata.AAC.1
MAGVAGSCLHTSARPGQRRPRRRRRQAEQRSRSSRAGRGLRAWHMRGQQLVAAAAPAAAAGQHRQPKGWRRLRQQ